MNDIQHDSPARLLIVDDSPFALRLLKDIFESLHYDVLTASDGMEGYAKTNQFKPDLVITDNVMPMMGGMALLKKLRENPGTRALPVIILTAEDPSHMPPDDLAKPDAFVMKTADMESLVVEVKRLLKDSHRHL